MQIIYKAVKDLTPYAKNAKKHDRRQIDNVAASIRQYGWRQPIVIDKDNVVVIGHCRLLAAEKLQLEQVPCVVADDLTEEQIKALRLVDNKTNESDWDMDFLAEELDGLDLGDIDLDWGVETDKKTVVEDNFETILPAIPQSKYGQVYQLGKHRLMCGDSTSTDDVQKLAGGGTNGYAAH